MWSCEYSHLISRWQDYLITESNGSDYLTVTVIFFLSVLWKWMQCWYGFVSFSDSATGSYFYPTARFAKRRCLLCLPLLKFSPSFPPFSSVRWSSRWRKQKPSDGRSWRERDSSPTSSTSIPVSPHAAALTHAPVQSALAIIFLFSPQRSIWAPVVFCSALKQEWAVQPH